MQIQVLRKVENLFVVDLCLFSEKLGSRVDSLEEVLSGLKKMTRYNHLSQHSENVIDLTSENEIALISDETITVDEGIFSCELKKVYFE